MASSSNRSPLVPGTIGEGHSLFYAGLLWLLKGPIPEGHDILCRPRPSRAGSACWSPCVNLIPTGQLDGGHIAYALLGAKQQRVSRIVRRLLFAFGFSISAIKLLLSWRQGASPEHLETALFSGANLDGVGLSSSAF